MFLQPMSATFRESLGATGADHTCDGRMVAIPIPVVVKAVLLINFLRFIYLKD
jgi:hypothetical protein